MFNKNLHQWLPSYIIDYLKNHPTAERPIHILFAIADHFEPYWNGVSDQVALKRVRSWCKRFPEVVRRFKDADGRYPAYTFFYPEEEYKYEYLDMLTDICKQGFGDVEIHLHHDNDTSYGLKTKLINFKTRLYEKHGLLHKDPKTGEILYGFIHGNWALDNSRKDRRWCGINDEITILKETGCYADFTLPSAPSDTQTRKINSIYYVKDDIQRPKSHDTGIDVGVGKSQSGDLMLIQGPLALNWKKRKWKLFPKIENGEIAHHNPPTPERIDLWINQRIHVKGMPEWVFIKVYTHGAQEENMNFLLNGGLNMLYSHLNERYNDGKEYLLHYVTAWEIYNIIKAAEAGKTGNPSQFRNYLSDASI